MQLLTQQEKFYLNLDFGKNRTILFGFDTLSISDSVTSVTNLSISDLDDDISSAKILAG